ncbi:hypothetical protein GCM10020255_028680 [Rhodococcus baikonurensis]
MIVCSLGAGQRSNCVPDVESQRTEAFPHGVFGIQRVAADVVQHGFEGVHGVAELGPCRLDQRSTLERQIDGGESTEWSPWAAAAEGR